MISADIEPDPSMIIDPARTFQLGANVEQRGINGNNRLAKI
jgi:hypothetical protein